eukprot:scaffold14709_cov268-Ochromonas_danica.AAC.8
MDQKPLFLLTLKKVQVMEDWRTLDDMKSTFPSVDTTVIENVWNSQHSWSACFDVLSSLVNSHGRICMNDCDHLFNDTEWPSLPTTKDDSFVLNAPAPPSTSRQVSTGSTASCSTDWTIIQLDSLHIYDVENTVEVEVDSLHSWTLIGSGANTDTNRSYKDMLLKRVDSQPATKHAFILPTLPMKLPWKPVIKVDRVSAPLPAPQPELRLDEEEEDELWDRYFSGTGQSVPAKRRNNALHVRPVTLEKKLKRMALK